MTSSLIGKRAVVVGAGMAGLPAARTLADYFEQVVVLERDTLPFVASHRTGIPQGRHTHALLAGGQRALGDLFPGFEQDLTDAGAVPVNAGLDFRFERPGYDPFPVRDLGLVVCAMSRPLIELTVRRRVEQYNNITIREHCRVQDLASSPDGGTVSAVRFENSEGRSETLATDLVVEASGRGYLTNSVLESLGRAPRAILVRGSTMSMPNSGRSGACRRSTAAGVNSGGASSGENLTLGTGSEGGSRPKAVVRFHQWQYRPGPRTGHGPELVGALRAEKNCHSL